MRYYGSHDEVEKISGKEKGKKGEVIRTNSIQTYREIRETDQ
jgi:ribosomal protein L24